MSEQEDDGNEIAPDSIFDNVSFLRPDVELEVLVRAVNKVRFEMLITLVTTGGIVSGQLIPAGMFWNSTAELINAIPATDPQSAAALGALAKAYMGRAAEAEADADPSRDEDDDWPPRYIHLNDAQVHDGGAYVNVGLWRGGLARVVGWSFGSAPS